MNAKRSKIYIALLLAFALIIPFGSSVLADWGVQPELLGDADLNGSVEAADAAFVLRHVVRLNYVTDNYQLAHMDTDEDGVITAADASHILQYIVKLNVLPYDPNYIPYRPTTAPTPTLSTSPRVTATPTPTPTPTPVPTPTPYLYTSNGLVLHASDPYFAKILNFYNGVYNSTAYTYTSGGRQVEIKSNSANCKNIIGWIEMSFTGRRNNRDGTTNGAITTVKIDYPIMYAPDHYYGTRNEAGTSIESGAIYSQYNVLQKNNVISGHNSRPNAWRFHDLHTLQNKIIDESSGGVAGADYIFDISLFGYYKWQVWAMYETTTSEPESTQIYNLDNDCGNNVPEWILTQLLRSEVNFQVDVSSADTFLTLETCGDKYASASDAQSRLYIFLVLIDD